MHPTGIEGEILAILRRSYNHIIHHRPYSSSGSGRWIEINIKPKCYILNTDAWLENMQSLHHTYWDYIDSTNTPFNRGRFIRLCCDLWRKSINSRIPFNKLYNKIR